MGRALLQYIQMIVKGSFNERSVLLVRWGSELI